MGQLTKLTTEIERDLLEGLDNQPKEDVVWDDLRSPATTLRQGNTTKPDFDETDLGLLFPNGDATEIAYSILQFPHNRKSASNIRPHIHYIQTSALVPVFKIAYRWYNNGENPPATFTELTCESHIYTYTSGGMLQICSFPEIDGSLINDVSSIFDVKIYRDDVVVTGDVLMKEFDIHYQIDQIGSRSEFAK